MRRAWWLAGTAAVLVVLLVSGALWQAGRPPAWRVISPNDYLVGPVQTLPPNGISLFQTEEEFQGWLQAHGKRFSRTDPQDIYVTDLDFSRETVAVIIESYSGWAVQGVAIKDGKATVTLSARRGVVRSSPALRVGEEIRQGIILRMPKVTGATVVETWQSANPLLFWRR